MNFLCDLIYHFSPKKSSELVRRLLKKNPRWALGHLLLAEGSSEKRVIAVSLSAIEVLGCSEKYQDRIRKLRM